MLGGFLWACPTCGGRAGTLALLRHRTPRAALTALREAARAAGQGGGGGTPYLGLGSEGESAWVADDARSCPSCARPLPRVAVPAHGIAEALDVCPRCDLVWFERTTMSALPLRPTLPAGPRPYPPRPSLDRSGRRLAWRHDGATGQGRPSAVVLASDDLAREPVEAALPPARPPVPTGAVARAKACVGRLLLLVAVGASLGATAATVAPHAARDAASAIRAAVDGRLGDLVGGAIPFLVAVSVTVGFWMSARRRVRRRMAEAGPPI